MEERGKAYMEVVRLLAVLDWLQSSEVPSFPPGREEEFQNGGV